MQKRRIALGLAIATIISTPVFGATGNIITYNDGNGSGGGSAIVTEDNITTPRTSEYVYDGDTKAGYWLHGKREFKLYSEMKGYKPYSGRASVTNGRDEHDDGGWKASEVWSKASVEWTIGLGTNKANYDYKK